MTSGRRKNNDGRKDNTAIPVALIGAAALIIVGIITMVSPAMQDRLKGLFPTRAQVQPAPVVTSASKPTPPKMKQSYCNDSRTGQPYAFDVATFDPVHYTHLNEPFGGDSVNPGHKFYLPHPAEAPGFVLSARCRHDGSSEEITYCGALRSAQGQPTKFAEIEGWINGQGGPTYMTVLYQMPCEVPDDAK
jgi:hypothetical protein